MKKNVNFNNQILWNTYNPINCKNLYLNTLNHQQTINSNPQKFYFFFENLINRICFLKINKKVMKPDKIEFHHQFGWILKRNSKYSFLGKIDIANQNLKIHIGRNSYFSGHSKIYGAGTLEIGSFTCIGENFFAVTDNDNHQFTKQAFIQTHNSRLNFEGFNFRLHKKLKSKTGINIGHNVWIGRNVTIKSSVSVGDNSCIAESSLVRRNVDSNSLFAGLPAKKIKNLDKNIKHKWWFWSLAKLKREKDLIFN